MSQPIDIPIPKEKKLTKAQIKRIADKAALEAVYTFVRNYFDLAEDAEPAHNDNEDKFLQAIMDIYDPEIPADPIQENQDLGK